MALHGQGQYTGNYEHIYRKRYGEKPLRTYPRMAAGLVEPNRNKWSDDHCIAVDDVPRVLFTLFKLQQPVDSIQDVADLALHPAAAPQ